MRTFTSVASHLQRVSRKNNEIGRISRTSLHSPFRTYSNETSGWKQKPFTILGIETSCDDTGVALVNSHGQILGQSLASQFHIHNSYGGIKPNLATREHEKNIEIVFNEAIQRSGITDVGKQISAVGVTVGPGLSTCLRVGIKKAQQLCDQYQLPLICVNHLEGHALMARMQKDDTKQITFPYLLVLVSGGHSQLLVCKGVGDYTQLGGTLDDSLGEAYDKVARMLGFTFQEGGRGLEELAREGDPLHYKLPMPMTRVKNCDWSFAGIKAATARLIESISKGSDGDLLRTSRPTAANIAASFQNIVLRHVVERTERALLWCNERLPGRISTIVVAGGVARNQEMRKRLKNVAEPHGVEVYYPPMELCTDNGVMIAWAAVESVMAGTATLLKGREAINGVEAKSRLPLTLSEEEHIFNTEYNDVVKLKRRGAI